MFGKFANRRIASLNINFGDKKLAEIAIFRSRICHSIRSCSTFIRFLSNAVLLFAARFLSPNLLLNISLIFTFYILFARRRSVSFAGFAMLIVKLFNRTLPRQILQSISSFLKNLERSHMVIFLQGKRTKDKSLK